MITSRATRRAHTNEHIEIKHEPVNIKYPERVEALFPFKMSQETRCNRRQGKAHLPNNGGTTTRSRNEHATR